MQSLGVSGGETDLEKFADIFCLNICIVLYCINEVPNDDEVGVTMAETMAEIDKRLAVCICVHKIPIR